MKVGFLLGSFDPPHIGHMHMISMTLQELDLVVVVPAMQNPWKERQSTNFELRCQMLEDITKPFGDSVIIQDLEKDLEPPYYSYKTLEKLKEIYNKDSLFIICGHDVYGEMHKWNNAKWIFENFIQFPVSRNIINISSTNIRNKVAEYKEIYPYTSEGVRTIINNNNLYK